MEQLCTTVAELLPFAMYWTIGIAVIGFIGTIALIIFAFSRVNKHHKEMRIRFKKKDW